MLLPEALDLDSSPTTMPKRARSKSTSGSWNSAGSLSSDLSASGTSSSIQTRTSQTQGASYDASPPHVCTASSNMSQSNPYYRKGRGISSVACDSASHHESSAKKWWINHVVRLGAKRRAATDGDAEQNNAMASPSWPPMQHASDRADHPWWEGQWDQEMSVSASSSPQRSALPLDAHNNTSYSSGQAPEDIYLRRHDKHLREDNDRSLRITTDMLHAKDLLPLDKKSRPSLQFHFRKGLRSSPSDQLWSIGPHTSTPAPSHASVHAYVPHFANPAVISPDYRYVATPTAWEGEHTHKSSALSYLRDAQSTAGYSHLARLPTTVDGILNDDWYQACQASAMPRNSASDFIGHIFSSQQADRGQCSEASQRQLTDAPDHEVNLAQGNKDKRTTDKAGFAAHFQSRPQCRLSEFHPVITLGTGTFGRVLLVRHKDAPPENPAGYLALKVLNKANIVRLKQVAHVNAERFVLGKIDHPFIVKL